MDQINRQYFKCWGNDRIPKRMSKLLRGDLALDYTVK